MKIHQLSVFVENRVGRLRAPCDVLAHAGMNIATLCLADTQQYGILRIIVRDWQKAKTALEQHGFVVNVTEVLAIEVPDRPGGLAEVLRVIEEAEINVEYMYAFAEKLGDKAALVFRVKDPDAAVEALAQSSVNVIGNVELYSRLDRA
ncbi:MAG: ACT domain-containing protein [Planctomycetota bacterium]